MLYFLRMNASKERKKIVQAKEQERGARQERFT